MFGPQSFTTTTRNMTLDLRGEAAYSPNLTGDIPVGASVSSLAMGAAMDYSNCEQGCGCKSNPAGVNNNPGQMRASAYPESVQGRFGKCHDACKLSSRNGQERSMCLRECAADVPARDRFKIVDSDDDQHQDCVTSCVSEGGASESDCITICKNTYMNRGGRVNEVHSSNFFTPRQVRPATVLRPYQS